MPPNITLAGENLCGIMRRREGRRAGREEEMRWMDGDVETKERWERMTKDRSKGR